MDNLKKVKSNNIQNVESLKKWVKENDSIENISEFIEILLKVCPNIESNNCSDKNKMVLSVGRNKDATFKKILTSVCYNPVVLPFSASSDNNNFIPVIHIKERDSDINVITIFLKSISDIEIEDYSALVNDTERYKILFKCKSEKNCMDYSIDLRIANK